VISIMIGIAKRRSSFQTPEIATVLKRAIREYYRI
jgi:hypothetical protein